MHGYQLRKLSEKNRLLKDQRGELIIESSTDKPDIGIPIIREISITRAKSVIFVIVELHISLITDD